MQIGSIDILEFGNTVLLAGAVFSDQNNQLHQILLPNVKATGNCSQVGDDIYMSTNVIMPSLENWKELLKQVDTKLVEVVSDDPLKKALVRKCERSIENRVSWKVFKRDGYACRYCGSDDTPLTVDHLVCWEELGPSIEENLISACSKCNKMRGNMKYSDWLNSRGYKERSKSLTPEQHASNLDLVPTLSSIPRRQSQKSR